MPEKTEEVDPSSREARHTPRHQSDPANWVEKPAVTGRPVDVAPDNSTFAERAKNAKKPDAKAVKSDQADVEDKAVTSSRARTKS